MEHFLLPKCLIIQGAAVQCGRLVSLTLSHGALITCVVLWVLTKYNSFSLGFFYCGNSLRSEFTAHMLQKSHTHHTTTD